MKHSQLGWRPIVSSGFGFDPFSLCGNIRAFYERWYAQGGHSARDHCGMVKRAKDLTDLRLTREIELWNRTNWKLQQNRAGIRICEISKEIKRNRLRAIK
jgi:hypothetical protein